MSVPTLYGILVQDDLRSKELPLPTTIQHLVFCWFGHFDRVVAQKHLKEEQKSERISQAQRFSASGELKLEYRKCMQATIRVQACNVSRSRANLSASKEYLNARAIRDLKEIITKSECEINKLWSQIQRPYSWIKIHGHSEEVGWLLIYVTQLKSKSVNDVEKM